MGDVIQILPVAAGWVGCYCLARELAARKTIDGDWRLSAMFASVAWAAILTAIIELASLVKELTALTIWMSWLVADMALFALMISLWRRRRSGNESLIQSKSKANENRDSLPRLLQLRERWRAARSIDFSEWPWDARCYLAVTVALVAFLFGLAVTFATTNWDSLNYHLPRILHWAQQQSVDHFPTNNSRHIEFGPWSAFASLTLYLLWGGDRLVNLVQWFAMVGTLVAVSFVVRMLAFREELSGAQRHRITSFTVLVAATLPMGLVQCMNPQNDYTATFWLCCLAAFALALFREPANGWYMVGAGLACGIGTLTKATTYVYAAPLILAFALWWLWRKFPFKQKLRLGGVFCGLFLLLNAGHMLRNAVVFGSPLSSKHIMALEKNGRITASGTAANVLRNLSLHSNSGVGPLTRALNAGFARAHGWTGRTFKDPEITYYLPGFFTLYNDFSVFDSYAPATWHLALVLLALTLACLKPRPFRAALYHGGWIIVSFLLFCACLKWQYWHTRLHLAYFVLLAPVVGWVFVERLPRAALPALAAGLVFFACFTLAHNQSRPFLNPQFAALPRENQYLAAHLPMMNEPAERLADAIIRSGRNNVGLKLEFDAAKYPIWVMLQNRGFNGVLQHLFVENESRKIPPRFREPDLLIVSRALGTPGPALTNRYPVSVPFGNLLLMAREGWDESAGWAEDYSRR